MPNCNECGSCDRCRNSVFYQNQALRALSTEVQSLQNQISQLQESVYVTGFRTQSPQSEIVLGPVQASTRAEASFSNTNITPNSVSITDGQQNIARLTSETLYLNNVDVIKTLAALLIPVMPTVLVNLKNNPLNTTDQTLFSNDFTYWFIIYSLSNTKIPIQAEANATYFINNFYHGLNKTFLITFSGYFPYAAYCSFTFYEQFSGNVIGRINSSEFVASPGSTNPFIVGNQVRSDINTRRFTLTVSNDLTQGATITLPRLYESVVVVYRVYQPYEYAPMGVPNEVTDPYTPTQTPVPTSTVNNPTWVFEIEGVVQPTERTKAPAPLFTHFITRPVPTPSFPYPFYRLSSIEVPYGDGAPFEYNTDYLACFIEIGRKILNLTVTLPTTFNVNTINEQTVYGDYDVAYLSWSIYSLTTLYQFTVSSNLLLSLDPLQTTFEIVLLDSEVYDTYLNRLTYPYIRENVLYSAPGRVNAVLPMVTSQQNILIQRSKNINSQFSLSVRNVPISNLTILGSFDPSTYVANSTEMGVYLPVITDYIP